MRPPEATPPSTLVIACGVLAKELLAITNEHQLDHVTIECLPGSYHHAPAKITPAVRARIERAQDRFDRIYVGYADCGTGGHLDLLLEEFPDVERLPGAHCYEFFAGATRFARLADDEPGTFYLTDYLVRHFDRFVWQMLGLDRHPQLRDLFFGNYTRMVYLAQVPTADLLERAEAAAALAGLPLEIIATGYGELEAELVELAERPVDAPARRRSILTRTPKEAA